MADDDYEEALLYEVSHDEADGGSFGGCCLLVILALVVTLIGSIVGKVAGWFG